MTNIDMARILIDRLLERDDNPDAVAVRKRIVESFVQHGDDITAWPTNDLNLLAEAAFQVSTIVSPILLISLARNAKHAYENEQLEDMLNNTPTDKSRMS